MTACESFGTIQMRGMQRQPTVQKMDSDSVAGSLRAREASLIDDISMRSRHSTVDLTERAGASPEPATDELKQAWATQTSLPVGAQIRLPLPADNSRASSLAAELGHRRGSLSSLTTGASGLTRAAGRAKAAHRRAPVLPHSSSSESTIAEDDWGRQPPPPPGGIN